MPPFFQTHVGLKTICKFTAKLEQEKELTPGLGHSAGQAGVAAKLWSKFNKPTWV